MKPIRIRDIQPLLFGQGDETIGTDNLPGVWGQNAICTGSALPRL
jgi:hypothetical protein